MTRFFLHILPGLAVSLLGAFVLAGEWIIPHWIEQHAAVAMYIGLNSALCFVLAGAALLLDARRSPMERRLQLACGAMIFTLALVVLFQLALDAYPAEAGWRYLLNVRADPGGPLAREGAMGAAMAVAFALCGATLVLMAATNSISSGIVAQCTAAAMICVALVGVFSGTLGNILFYEQGPGHTLINLPTAAVISLLAVGLYLRVTDAPWFRHFYREREDIRLFTTGVALFALTAFLTGLTTIGIVGRYAMSNFQESLERSFHSAVSAFQFSADMAVDRSMELVSLSALPELVRAGASRERINHEVDRILQVAGRKDMAAIAIMDIHGRHVAGAAADVHAEHWRALVPASIPSYLYWDNRWRLRIRVPLQAGGRAVGSAIVDANLNLWDDQFNRIRHFGTSGESCLCLRDEGQLRCFPTEPAGPVHDSRINAAGRKGQSFAMQSALSGREGVAVVKDYRGNDVIAAFGPLAPRLGLVLKVDADEFYAPLRRQLWFALLGLVLLFFIGAAILYWRTRPLVKSLVHARARLDAILNNVPAGVLISDRGGKIESANRTAEQMFDYGAGELAGKDIKDLLQSEASGLEIDNPNAQVLAGRRKDGTSFPAAVVTREFFLKRGRRQIAIVFDITERHRVGLMLKKWADIFENVEWGVVVGDAEGRCLELMNPAFARMHGFTVEELTGRPIAEVFAPEERPRLPEIVRLSNQLGRHSYESVHLRKDGTTFPVWIDVTAIKDEHGKVLYRAVNVLDISERKRIEQKLRHNEQLLRKVLEALPVGVWVLDARGGVLMKNAAAERLCEGIAPGEPEGFCRRKAWHASTGVPLVPEDWGIVRALQEGVTTLGSSIEVECADGRRKVLKSSAVPLLDDAGDISGAIEVNEDITERIAAQRLLLKREEQFRALVENSPDAIARFGRDARCKYANPAMQTAIGLRWAEIEERLIDEMNFPPLVAAMWNDAIRNVFLTRLVGTFDFSLPGPGGVRYYQTRMVPEYGPDGEVLVALAVARDISVLKGGEAVLYESEQRLYGITSNIPGMVFQCRLHPDADNLHFTYVSNGVVSLLGLTPGEVLGNRDALLSRIAVQDRNGFLESLRQSAGSMTVWNWEGRIAGIHGQVWVNCRATPRPGENGQVQWEGVMLNISESKRKEQEIRESRQLLRELSAHMESVKEEERKRIAREVHDELGQALTALRMDVSMLRLTAGEEHPQFLERIHSMKERVDSTIGLVRNITAEMRPAALDLGLTAAIEWLVEDFVARAGIPCSLRTGGSEVVLDDSTSTALFRIVQESLVNIIKHAQASRVDISIREEGGQVCVEVIDDGVGFPSHAAPKPGSFGLIGMRERTLMIGGTLCIESQPGAGTKIVVCIPGKSH